MEQQLSAQLLQEHLSTKVVGSRVLFFPSIHSTMREAQEEAERNAPEGTLVLADEQIEGRGRFDRRWISPPGQNLYLSVLLRPEPRDLSRLTMVASLAVVRCLGRSIGQQATIKWPNDVRLRGKKVGGILIESSIEDGRPRYAIVGIGLNVNMDSSNHPEIAETATSLAKETGHTLSRLEVLLVLLEEMDRLYLGLRHGIDPQQEWAQLLETLGKKVQVRWGDEVEEGLAEEVDGDGNLLLRLADGTVKRVSAGEVTLQV